MLSVQTDTVKVALREHLDASDRGVRGRLLLAVMT